MGPVKATQPAEYIVLVEDSRRLQLSISVTVSTWIFG